MSRTAVRKLRARFLRDRLEVPEGATHWPERELARRVGISPSSMLRVLPSDEQA